jgi:fatty-acyl-CoA synthase
MALRECHWPADETIPLLREPIGSVLRGWARGQPDAPALLWESSGGIARMSYAELLAAAEALAGWMLERAATCDRIAVWSRNRVEVVLVEHGCALAGTVFTPFNPAWTDHEAEHAVALTRPAIVFAGADGRGAPLVERARKLASGSLVLEIASVSGLRSARNATLPDLSDSAPFLIQFTSGTTRRAKGALLSQRAALNSG